MRIHRAPDRDTACATAASILSASLRSTPAMVLGLATGRTMAPLYRRLLSIGTRLERVTTFNLDEYVGLAPDDPRSFHATMHRLLFAPAGMPGARTHLPDAHLPDRAAAAAAHEHAIERAGGIALQLLGIGRNGHLGFNEPGSDFGSRTRDVVLSLETRLQNAADFHDEPARVPARAITAGLGTILDARRILLLATGAEKAVAIARLLRDPPSPALPASCLRTHPEVDLVLDAEAAGRLDSREIPNPAATL